MRKFQFVISLPCSSIAVRLVEVRTEARARELAERVFKESPEHLGVDVWEGENHLFTIGQAGRQVA